MNTRPERKPRGRPTRESGVSLSAEQIVQAALEVIDEGGLDAFSVRDVARKLGVYPAALYWYFPGKRNAVLAEVASTAFLDVLPSFSPEENWQDWIRQLFFNYRNSVMRHPNIAPLIGAQLVSNGGVNLGLVEQVLTALKSAGFRSNRLIDAYNVVIASMLGYVTLELAPAPPDNTADWADELQRKVQSAPASEYPLIVKNRDKLTNNAFILRWESGTSKPLARGFAFYVETVIAGLENSVGQPA